MVYFLLVVSPVVSLNLKILQPLCRLFFFFTTNYPSFYDLFHFQIFSTIFLYLYIYIIHFSYYCFTWRCLMGFFRLCYYLVRFNFIHLTKKLHYLLSSQNMPSTSSNRFSLSSNTLPRYTTLLHFLRHLRLLKIISTNTLCDDWIITPI